MRISTFLIPLVLLSISYAKETSLIDFELQDQFERTYTQDSFDGKTIIMLGADREGSQYTDQWGPTLADSLVERGYIDSVQFVALATLEGVPGIMKGIVKGFFPKDEEHWVLMDWQGLFAKAYEFTPDKCNIIVFDQEKNLIAQEAVTDFDKATVEKLLEVITP